ncbi:MAG: hypothetical protein SAJ11_20025 [Jaaginema sp. PMC 1078.18]|nr:hypothetical protein [Jaaginema sp. PMC 1078.18]
MAAKNIAGENHDLWNVNLERSYHEDFTKEQWKKQKSKEVCVTVEPQHQKPDLVKKGDYN